MGFAKSLAVTINKVQMGWQTVATNIREVSRCCRMYSKRNYGRFYSHHLQMVACGMVAK
jgi:hypothetical protein